MRANKQPLKRVGVDGWRGENGEVEQAFHAAAYHIAAHLGFMGIGAKATYRREMYINILMTMRLLGVWRGYGK